MTLDIRSANCDFCFRKSVQCVNSNKETEKGIDICGSCAKKIANVLQ